MLRLLLVGHFCVQRLGGGIGDWRVKGWSMAEEMKAFLIQVQSGDFDYVIQYQSEAATDSD